MALPTLNTANGLSKPIAQQTEPDSQGNEGDTSITRWNHLSKPVAQQTEPDSQGNEGDTSIIHWNRLSKPIAQLMEQVSQGISVCTEGDAASITHLSVSLKQYLQYYQAVEGPLTDYESGPDDGEPVEGPLTDYEGSDDDEQRAFYGDLSDVGTSDSEEQRAFYGDMGDMGTSDNEEQRAFYGDLSDISDDAFYGDLSDAGDGEQMLLCDDLTDMSISDEDATASASIAPIVQRTKAEKKAARKRAHLIRKIPTVNVTRYDGLLVVIKGEHLGKFGRQIHFGHFGQEKRALVAFVNRVSGVQDTLTGEEQHLPADVLAMVSEEKTDKDRNNVVVQARRKDARSR
ncbi:hypothetical protein JOM56_009042 [Amanita muscaria]